MKLEIEVYSLDQTLYYIKDTKVDTFVPKALKITSDYEGYTGYYWGDTYNGKGGFPIRIFYSEENPAKSWIPHYLLFKTKEELLKSL